MQCSGKGSKTRNRDRNLPEIKCFRCHQYGHYANDCMRTQKGGQPNKRGDIASLDNHHNDKRRVTIAHAGNLKICSQCGYQGKRHPRESTCPSINRKKAKKDSSHDEKYDWGSI